MSDEMLVGLKAIDEPRAFRPFTINRKTNSEMANLILSYYGGPRGFAIDVTYGVGTFWRRPLTGWLVKGFDREPISEKITKAEWNELGDLLRSNSVDAVFFDPPYSSGKGGFDLDSTEGYSRMKRTAAHTANMKYGRGDLPSPLAATIARALKPEGILVFKNQEFQDVDGFTLYDYLIQDNGFQPDGFKITKPKARPNHAFWMIFKPKPI